MPEDIYKREFHIGMGNLLSVYFCELEKHGASVWRIGGNIVNPIVLESFFEKTCRWGDYYSESRRNGLPEEVVFKKFEEYLRSYRIPEDYREGEQLLADVKVHLWYDALLPYRGRTLVYLAFLEQLEVTKAFICSSDTQVVLLSERELPEEIDLPDSVTAITLELPEERCFTNIFLECNFPLVYYYFNLFDPLIRILRPERMIVWGDGGFQEEVLAIVCKACGVLFIKR